MSQNNASLIAVHIQYSVCCVVETMANWVMFVRAFFFRGKFRVINTVHLLDHLINDYRRFGNLMKISAFKYENQSRLLTKPVRNNNTIISQNQHSISWLRSSKLKEQRRYRYVNTSHWTTDSDQQWTMASPLIAVDYCGLQYYFTYYAFLRRDSRGWSLIWWWGMQQMWFPRPCGAC